MAQTVTNSRPMLNQVCQINLNCGEEHLLPLDPPFIYVHVIQSLSAMVKSETLLYR